MAAKKAIITGASSGIGLEFAKALAKEGYDLTLVARTHDKMKELASSLPGNHTIISADLSTDAGIDKIAKEISKGNYDILVNNAGVGRYSYFHEEKLDILHKMTKLNVDAVFILAHEYLKNAKSGDAMIITSSALAFLAMPKGALYTATKAFDSALGQSLWYEQKKRGVYVLTLYPGATRTNFMQASGGSINSMPENLFQNPDKVVEEAMKALKARKQPVVISGRKNRFLIFLTKLMSKKQLINMMGKRIG